MKGMLLSAYKQLDLVDMPSPQPAEDELLIRIKACGICGSDVHGYDGSTGRRLPPIVMGHEAAGVVESVGSAVSNFRPGDRVTFDSTVYCGKCFFCQRATSIFAITARLSAFQHRASGEWVHLRSLLLCLRALPISCRITCLSNTRQ